MVPFSPRWATVLRRNTGIKKALLLNKRAFLEGVTTEDFPTIKGNAALTYAANKQHQEKKGGLNGLNACQHAQTLLIDEVEQPPGTANQAALSQVTQHARQGFGGDA